jgi:hypothetical protein
VRDGAARRAPLRESQSGKRANTLPTDGVIPGRDAIPKHYGGTMGRQAGVVLYVLALVAVVVGVDVFFFRHRFWERLMANVGIVVVFAVFYLRFLKRE